MERHIAKRLGIPCAVISAPVHVQDFPARYSPQMGFEGANVLFDTWIHPLTMGLEEHLLTMFREDFEFHDEAGPSHHGGKAVPASAPRADEAAEALPLTGAETAEGGRSPRGRAPGRGRRSPRGRDRLADGCRARAEEDPLLRARQGTPEHREVCG